MKSSKKPTSGRHDQPGERPSRPVTGKDIVEALRASPLGDVPLEEEIAKGLADIKAGRVREFDADAIIRAGEKIRAGIAAAERGEFASEADVTRIRKKFART